MKENFLHHQQGGVITGEYLRGGVCKINNIVKETLPYIFPLLLSASTPQPEMPLLKCVEDPTQFEKAKIISANFWEILFSGKVSDFIEEMGKKHNVDPDLIKAVIFQESKLNPLATSSAGATGLMQIMPANQDYFWMSDPYDWQSNIEAGVQILAESLERRERNVSLALADYNAGLKAVNKAGKQVPPYEETHRYIANVMQYYQFLKSRHNIGETFERFLEMVKSSTAD